MSDIVQDLQEFILANLDTASPSMVQIITEQIIEQGKVNYQGGGNVDGADIPDVTSSFSWQERFNRDPNKHATTTNINTGIVYDTDTGLPVVELSEYPVDEREQTARNNSMFDINSMSNAAIARSFQNAIFSETNVLGLPNIPTPTLHGMFNFLATKDTQIVARNAFYSKPIDDQIDIMSRIDDKNEFGLKNVYNPKIREGILEIALPMTEAESEMQQVNQVPYPSSQSYTTQPNVPLTTTSLRTEPPEFYRSLAESGEKLHKKRLGWVTEKSDKEDAERASLAAAKKESLAAAKKESLAAAPEQQAMDREIQDQALEIDVGLGAGVDVGTPDVSVDAPSRGVPDTSHGGAFNRGGPANMQLGGEAENADTNMEVANVPMGVVSDRDGAPSPFRGGTGVADDLEMEVEAGSYVLNAEAVQLVGISDINTVIRDAYTIAAKLGKLLPEDYDPQNKVPIRISNGEAVIPRSLVEIIGIDKLEKWNEKGLQLRKQKEAMQAKQQQAQPQGPQVASEAPPVQPQSPMQAQMGGLMGYNEGDEVEEEDEITLMDRVSKFFGFDFDDETLFKKLILETLKETGSIQDALKEIEEATQEKAKGGEVQNFKNGGFISNLLDKSEKLIEKYITDDEKFPRKAVLKMTSLATHLPYKLGIGDTESWKENPVIQKIINNDPIIEKIIQAESSGRPRIMSEAGGIGLMQIMPDTWKQPGLGMKGRKDLQGLLDPEENVKFGSKYFNKLLQRLNGNTEHALIAYNWGIGNTEKWIKKGADKNKLPNSTQRYIEKILDYPPLSRPRPEFD